MNIFVARKLLFNKLILFSLVPILDCNFNFYEHLFFPPYFNLFVACILSISFFYFFNAGDAIKFLVEHILYLQTENPYESTSFSNHSFQLTTKKEKPKKNKCCWEAGCEVIKHRIVWSYNLYLVRLKVMLPKKRWYRMKSFNVA